MLERAIRQSLEPLEVASLTIDHIGSTAVPGLDAKDVIDIQIGVTDDQALDAVALTLAESGFSLTSFTEDHPIPRWSPEPSQWKKRLVQQQPDGRAANILIRVIDRDNYRFARAFRDYLRANPDRAADYLNQKRRLAAEHHDTLGYSMAKDSVIDQVAGQMPSELCNEEL